MESFNCVTRLNFYRGHARNVILYHVIKLWQCTHIKFLKSLQKNSKYVKASHKCTKVIRNSTIAISNARKVKMGKTVEWKKTYQTDSILWTIAVVVIDADVAVQVAVFWQRHTAFLVDNIIKLNVLRRSMHFDIAVRIARISGAAYVRSRSSGI